MPYSPSRRTAQGRTRFWSRRMDSAILMNFCRARLFDGGWGSSGLCRIARSYRDLAFLRTLARFPELVDAAPKGLFMTGTSLVTLDESDPDKATGTQPLCFIEHSKHDMRIGYYNDTYVRTEDGWRLKTRAMTFIRRSGDHDSGRPHAIGRPDPDVAAGAAPEAG